MRVTARLHGGRELERTLRRLPGDATKRRVVRFAMRKALVPVRDAMAAQAPRQWGDLADSVKIGIIRRQRTETMGVGPSKQGFYGMFHEFGWSQVSQGQRNQMPARPFARPAFDQNWRRALAIYGEEMGKSITRTARRLARRGGA